MACFVEGCQVDEGLKKDPCIVCGKLIHHMCAIGVDEGSDSALNERYSPANLSDSNRVYINLKWCVGFAVLLVKKIAAVGNIPRKEKKAIYKNGVDFLRVEHREVFAQMTKQGKISPSQLPLSQSSLLSQDSSPFSSPSSTG
ncbi:hypothetical protein DVH05_028620 [Phytophthora capsici]|nr:hypothetical protein DVH05_028620 [Phytophthora capsici]